MLRAILTAGALLLLPATAAADDPRAGEQLAHDACAMCHKLPDGTGTTVGPAFAELAAERGPFGAEDVVAVLNQPQHAPAKARVTLPDDAGPLAAYLSKLAEN